MVTFGIEEEFLLMDPGSSMPSARAAELVASLTPQDGSSYTSTAELLASQVESSTPICTEPEEALASLLDFRGRLAQAAADAGLAAAPTGAAPLIDPGPALVSATERYRSMGEMTGAVAEEHYVNGTHVHVAVPDRDSGVQVLNQIRPWLATLGAISTNSPYWHGRDSMFASWRIIHYRRWSVQGCPPFFQDAADYDARLARLIATDVVLDSGHVGWIARLSDTFPTVEVRVADTQLEARDAVLLALVTRGLVTTALAEDGSGIEGSPDALSDPEILDAGLWQAARFGLGGKLLDHGPAGGHLGRSAADQVGALLAYIRPALEESGDYGYVRAGLAHMFDNGSGAQRQRAAVRQGGFAALGPLFAQALTAQ
ncbi:glutamate--cysteine ligase [Arthrobacter sp. zg-ZUI100]|uniref:Putative glutamate--cysteine ligase 2 n=1 Tax=Arthrobacter jiangjiafuii TaxID=2817475 RepID=A0A975QYY9_9MICC|nr:glutamate--cysteine ligase [Arthrobacter jiangjiafuii]MBP3034776.1 glutamate--cysteine ligase [Arthrobacter jiangjiafuii]MBP3044647.1 glutamate--cysteine ligase [Arthrobacter jiangjiafuii]QWC09260.1 glutamate--cysteine ligase [Arthrobacter jiangjiafuii]